MKLRKYPRTRHLEGSRLQAGDEDLAAARFSELAGRHLVVEEKIDGANSAVSFDNDGRLLLQSRGHYLSGGPRERHFARFKTWAHTHSGALRSTLTDRYILYGEWCYALHTIYYDTLPHYFLEFDILDRRSGVFLDTPRRRALLAPLECVTSVPILRVGEVRRLSELVDLVGPSLYKSDAWRERLRESARAQGLDPLRVAQQTDPSDDGEGLYIKVEEEGAVVARYKWIRPGFLQTVIASGDHWLARPLVPNGLASGVDLYALS